MSATTIRLVRCNARGYAVGEDAATSRFSDAAVAKAKELRAAGWTLSQIATELGCNFRTVSDWCLGKRRRPHARVVVKRVRSEQSALNHQQALKNPSAPSKDSPAGE